MLGTTRWTMRRGQNTTRSKAGIVCLLRVRWRHKRITYIQTELTRYNIWSMAMAISEYQELDHGCIPHA